MDEEYRKGNWRQLVASEKVRRRLLMQLADAQDMMGYLDEDRREARQALLAAGHWLRTNPDDWHVRDAHYRLREALLPMVSQSH